jgi:hypothetical protein
MIRMPAGRFDEREEFNPAMLDVNGGQSAGLAAFS